MRIWQAFPDVASAVRLKHEQVGLTGHHDFIHAFRVGEVARQVALAEWGDERLSHLAGLAGMCHNADRLLQKELGVGRRDVPRHQMISVLASWLVGAIAPEEVDMVTSAVFKHDGRNAPDDSQVLIALMDGDRVVNLDSDLFARSGQFYADLPVVDYRYLLDDPNATYRDPRSVFRDIAYSLEWADETTPVCIRTALGKRMAAFRVRLFRSVVQGLQDQLSEEGIWPYPFAD